MKLYGSLRGFRPASAGGQPHHPFTVELSPGETVAKLIDRLQIPEEMIHVVSIDGRQATMDSPLQDGETLHLFSPAAGG